ncbi:hypothetical protein ABZP36_009405 [Zizania latifolia]
MPKYASVQRPAAKRIDVYLVHSLTKYGPAMHNTNIAFYKFYISPASCPSAALLEHHENNCYQLFIHFLSSSNNPGQFPEEPRKKGCHIPNEASNCKDCTNGASVVLHYRM